MKRHITAEEVRRFFETVNRQFEEAGFYLNSVRFHRNNPENAAKITLNYTECTDDTQTDGTDLSDGQRDNKQP